VSDAYATMNIPKSSPIHEMALTSTGRKIEHNKVVVEAFIDELEFVGSYSSLKKFQLY